MSKKRTLQYTDIYQGTEFKEIRQSEKLPANTRKLWHENEMSLIMNNIT